jgi:hypothetical protein
MIKRKIAAHIENDMFRGKAILLYGARQTGKTTLMKDILRNRTDDVLFLSGDEGDVHELFAGITTTAWKNIIGSKKIVVIDEAQRISNIGIAIKLVIDHIPDVQVIATGSSSFDLANSTNEPLTGRKYLHHLFPLSFDELCEDHGIIEEKRNLDHRLVFGCYPEVVTAKGEEQRVLRLLAESYLFKDLLMLEAIKKSTLLVKILKSLALQIGNEVSFTEIAQLVGSNKNTVEKYIDLLEKVYVIFTLPAFSRNVRNELKNSRKIYFVDNGIRNAIIGNFQNINSRTDCGALWENFLISERIKLLSNEMKNTSTFFWRTTQQQEIDFIEERDGKLHAFEFKWNTTKTQRLPLTFIRAYPDHTGMTVTPVNFEHFLRLEKTAGS